MEIFGKAKQSNAERMVAIAESFASQGARQEDPGHGTGNPMNNRYFGQPMNNRYFGQPMNNRYFGAMIGE